MSMSNGLNVYAVYIQIGETKRYVKIFRYSGIADDYRKKQSPEIGFLMGIDQWEVDESKET